MKSMKKYLIDKYFVVIKPEYIEYAKKHGNKKYLMLPFFVLKHMFDLLKVIGGGYLVTDHIELVVTTKCSLRCADCANLMQYYTKPYHTDLNTDILSLSRLCDAVDQINEVEILGGEPFLWPHMLQLLTYVCGQSKIKKCKIVTNGTILPDEALLKMMGHEKVYVSISNYGKLSRKKDELIKIFQSKSIQYTMEPQTLVWRAYGNMKKRKRNRYELKRQYELCGTFCNSIINGKMHHCPRSSSGMDLDFFYCKEDYVDLLDFHDSAEELREKIKLFYKNRKGYVEACRYCDNATPDAKEIPSAVQGVRNE